MTVLLFLLRKIFQVGSILVLLPLAWIAPAQTSGATCEELLSGASRTLYETSVIYGLLRDLDRAGCAKLPSAEFEAFMEPREVNLVSYSLLEARLMDGDGSVRTEALQAYLQQYREAGSDLDENAILPLIDIAYYECRGATDCIGSSVIALTKPFALTRRAGCLYAMPSSCTADNVAPEFFFLNDVTLQALGSPAALDKRSEFICNRYRDCSEREE